MHWRSKRNDNSRVWQLASLQAEMLAAALHSLELEQKGLARFSRGFSRRRSSSLQAGADAPDADADAPAADEWTEEEDGYIHEGKELNAKPEENINKRAEEFA